MKCLSIKRLALHEIYSKRVSDAITAQVRVRMFFLNQPSILKSLYSSHRETFSSKLTFKHIDASALSPSTKGGDDDTSFVLGTSSGGELLLTSATAAGCDRVLFRLAASVLDLSVRFRVRGFSTGVSGTSALVLFSVKRQFECEKIIKLSTILRRNNDPRHRVFQLVL